MTPEQIQFQTDFIKHTRQIVLNEIDNHGLLRGHLRLGTVESVLPNSRLSVFVDGSNISQVIDCNPDVTFSVADFVWVTLVNGDPKNKFIFSRRK